MQVRRAVAGDAMAIATVHVRSWQGAYPGLIPQAYLDSLRPEDRVGDWSRTLADTAWPHRGTFVVVEPSADPGADSAVAGFVSIAPSRDGDADPQATGEILTIYLEPRCFGGDGGRLLMDSALEELGRAGCSSATLWVLDTNTRARRFYERHGWRPDGATKLHDWGAFVATDVRYAIDLG